ncbi:methyltransferase domain-containing protein [Sorangium sp. So ce321]|uniref:class I SAM-dependent methyltransferase n=1 Tax=Sorangium sp. So ce321 TaxID=3133300 RepID=UPI003F627368
MLVERNQSIEVLRREPPFPAAFFAEAGLTGLNVGCSFWNMRPGSLNIDLSKLENPGGQATEYGRLALLDGQLYYLEYDVTTPLPLPDASFDWLHTEHLIEHVPQDGAIRFLKEAHRVLKPGALLRISTPDLALYIDGYRDPSRKFFNKHAKILEHLGRMFPDVDDPFPEVQDRPAWMVNQIFKHWGHQWIYDFEEMAYALREAGFDEGSIERRSFRKGRDQQVADIDLVIHRDETLYVEAIKT